MKFKIILVGCGNMANVWVDYVLQSKGMEIVALVDIDIEAAKKLAENRNLSVLCFNNLSKAINKVDSNLVFDVTIPKSRKEVVLNSINHNIDVFGEKPMANTFEESIEVLRKVESTKRNYFVMQNRRYNNHFRNIKNAIDENVIGKIQAVHTDFFLGPHFGGFREEMEHPLILDMAIHTFDKARYLIDSKPKTVYTHEYNTSNSWYKGNASAVAIFEMENNSLFTYRGSWSSEGLSTTWDSYWRIQGELGTIIWDGLNEPKVEVVSETGIINDLFRETKQYTIPKDFEGREGHFGCLDEMFTALRENRLAETNCFDNIFSVAMIYGAIESAKLKKIIDIEKMLLERGVQ